MAKVKTNLSIDRKVKKLALAYSKQHGKSLSDVVQELLAAEVRRSSRTSDSN